MARLIIGHTTHESVTLWVRGEVRYPFAFVEVSDSGGVVATKKIALEERHGFTGAAKIEGLKANRAHTSAVCFGRVREAKPRERFDYGHCQGRFTTFPAPGKSIPFKFLLGSCNLHSLGPLSPPDKAFETLAAVAEQENPAFMIHCGDQIYYDIPNPWKPPSISEYRDKYLDAWEDSRATRSFLTRLPHYMILDDHEILDNFANDIDTSALGATPKDFKMTATKVYWEFVHTRQPNTYGAQALHYTFSHGTTEVFVLDTRTQRYARPTWESPRMVGPQQLSELADWMLAHKDAVKLVVTSVPFAGEARNSDDKWNAPLFRPQREAVMDLVLQNDIRGVTFLTGDMHNSYHATLELRGHGKTVVLHELMSSPINHIGKSSIEDYDTSTEFRSSANGKFTYRSRVRKFYDAHSNAMLVSVDGRQIGYEIFRTKKTKRRERWGSFTV